MRPSTVDYIEHKKVGQKNLLDFITNAHHHPIRVMCNKKFASSDSHVDFFS